MRQFWCHHEAAVTPNGNVARVKNHHSRKEALKTGKCSKLDLLMTGEAVDPFSNLFYPLKSGLSEKCGESAIE